MEKTRQQLSVVVDLPLMKAIDKIAASEHRTRAAYIKHVLSVAVEQRQSEADKAS